MTLKIITTRKEATAAQSELQAALRKQATASGRLKLGFQGGGMNADVCWLGDLDLWVGLERVDNRFWNALGVDSNPFESSGNVSIVVEINPPRSGINRQISGAFAKDDDGEVYLVHRGRVGGGRKGIGKSAFMSWWPGPTQELDDGEQRTTVIVVGRLRDEHLAARLAEFARRVAQFKELATAKSEATRLRPVEPNDGPGRDDRFTPERTVPRAPTRVAAEIEAQSTHGIVIGALHDAVTSRRVSVYNDKARDLYTTSDDGKLDVLFEVKSASTTTNIYEASSMRVPPTSSQ